MLRLSRDDARRAAQKRLDPIAKAFAAGQLGQAKRLARSFLQADAAKIHAAYRTLGGTATEDEAAQLAERIDAFQPCEHPVLWWRKAKKTGGHRILCELPAELHAAELLIRDVLSAQFRPDSHLFDLKGRGRDAQALSIQAVLKQGFTWVVQGDLRDAFQSVEVESLYPALPLPAAVIRHTLDYRNLRLRHAPEREGTLARSRSQGQAQAWGLYTPTVLGRSGPRGLLPGSPAANLLLAWLFNDLQSVLPPGCVPYLYADNVLVAARTEAECRAIELTLTRYFAEHFAGPFVLAQRSITCLKSGIEHLGYEFEIGDDGAVAIAPDRRNYLAMMEAFYAAVEADSEAGRTVPEEAFRILQRKLSGFSVMTDREGFLAWNVETMVDNLAERNWRRANRLRASA